MVNRNYTNIVCNQSLFGYEDGHRLLASSIKLPYKVASQLLMYSDVAPGLKFGKFESYWTGVPIPSLKMYALMQTWPANEISRPGCVWTHIVFIKFADMSVLSDLSVLKGLFVRPNKSDIYGSYSDTISLGCFDGLGYSKSWQNNCQDYLSILRALYSEKSTGVIKCSEFIDDIFFQIWSQQWPRLRRSFSFRTAIVSSESLASQQRFDFRIVYDGTGSKQVKLSNVERWEQVVIDDLSSMNSNFRNFLWKYGQDMHRGRERFRFLADIYLEICMQDNPRSVFADVADYIIKILPDIDDGKLLKHDLFSKDISNCSLLYKSDPLDVLDYFSQGKGRGSLPRLSSFFIDAIRDYWPMESNRILLIAQQAIVHAQDVAQGLFDALIPVIDSVAFFSVAMGFNILRGELIKHKPLLLDSPELVRLNSFDIVELLSFVPRDNSSAYSRIITRLFEVDDNNLSKVVFEGSPGIVRDCVISAVVENIFMQGPTVKSSWVNIVLSANQDLLIQRLLEKVDSTSRIYDFASLINFDIDIALKVGFVNWAKALTRSHDDVCGMERKRLLIFMLSLALAKPSHGAEALLEWSFDSIHSDLESSNMPDEYFTSLSRYLPDVSFWLRWDKCLRLEMAIVNAYIHSGLDSTSFLRITSDKDIFKKLIQIAKETKSGKRYVKNLSH